jgi:drug/metabolite transporter (DMT)-like permease
MSYPQRSGWAAVALLAFVTFAWGFAWPVTKVAVEQVPIWPLRAGTTLIGGSGMLVLARLAGWKVALPRRELAWLALLAQFNVTGWCLFSAYGVSLMAAGRAGIIAFTMPIWAAVLASAIGQERMTPAKLLALALGAAGLAALVLPDWQAVAAAPFGVLAMLGAAISWAIGTLGMKHIRWTSTAGVQSGWQLLFGTLPMWVGVVVTGARFDPAALDGAGWGSIVYLVAISMVLAQWAWFGAVHALSATIAGIGSLMVPVVGVLGSALWLGEEVGWPDLVSLALIGASVLLVMRPVEEAARPVPQPGAGRLGLDPERLG